jgi:hypothetical protein
MRNATLAVLGFAGLSLLLCASGEVVAQADTASPVAAAGRADASSAELQRTVLQLQSEVARLREDSYASPGPPHGVRVVHDGRDREHPRDGHQRRHEHR